MQLPPSSVLYNHLTPNQILVLFLLFHPHPHILFIEYHSESTISHTRGFLAFQTFKRSSPSFESHLRVLLPRSYCINPYLQKFAFPSRDSSCNLNKPGRERKQYEYRLNFRRCLIAHLYPTIAPLRLHLPLDLV